MNELDTLVESARQSFVQALTPADLENAKAQFLGKSGHITELMKGMAALSVDDKKTRGAAINIAKQAIEAALNDRRQALADAELQAQLKAEALDVTLPGRSANVGGLHPVSLTLERVENIFGSMGFEVAQGPEIETDWFNFTALNTPEDHPARSMHDTFYVEGGHLLRTHTSPMQIRHAMAHVQQYQSRIDAGQGMPEIRVIAPIRQRRLDGLLGRVDDSALGFLGFDVELRESFHELGDASSLAQELRFGILQIGRRRATSKQVLGLLHQGIKIVHRVSV